MNNGWVLLHRSLLEWEWYDDHNATRLLVHLILKVNWQEKKWKGIVIKGGQCVTSWNTLSEETGLTIKQVRVAMQKLENSGEVARKVASKWQLVSLVKWEKMQKEALEVAGNRASKGQAEGRQRATIKEREEREEGKEVYREFGKLSMTKDEFHKLVEDGYTPSQVDTIIDQIENYPKNTKYKSLYLTAKTWLKKEPKQKQQYESYDPKKHG